MLQRLMAALTGFVFLVLAAVPVSATVHAKPQEQLLYVIQVKDASIQPLGGKQFKLTIPLSGIHSVLAFSDRPFRHSFRLQPQQFANMVHQAGSDNFDKVKPNLAIAMGDASQPTTAFAVNGYQKTANTITYQLTQLGSEKSFAAAGGQMALFIDNAPFGGASGYAQCTVSVQLVGDSVSNPACSAYSTGGTMFVTGGKIQ
jgi:hypothetical protein